MGEVLTDLHAADVRYHVDCKATFMSPKSICSINRRSVSTELNDSVIWLKIKLVYVTPLTYTLSMWRKEDICFLGGS